MGTLYLTMLVIVGLISAILIFHKDYDDGIVGKLALGAMLLAAVGVVLDSTQGRTYEPLPINVMFIFGTTVFLLRFMYRWEKWRLGCRIKYGWKAPSMETAICGICHKLRTWVASKLSKV